MIAGVLGAPASSYQTVGTARPELLQILIRRHGKVRLYRGATFAFRTHRSSSPPTDAQWQKLIDQLPAPRFTKSYRSATR